MQQTPDVLQYLKAPGTLRAAGPGHLGMGAWTGVWRRTDGEPVASAPQKSDQPFILQLLREVATQGFLVNVASW